MQYRIILCLVSIILSVGIVSADTLILTENNDGVVTETTDQTWYAIRNDVGDNVVNNPASVLEGRTQDTTTEPLKTSNKRTIITWNTSVLAGYTITNVTISLDGIGQYNNGGSFGQSIIDVTPANSTLFVAGDYDATTFTRMATDIPYASYSSSWNNWTLNSNGLEKINTTGYSSFMFTQSGDNDNSSISWTSGQKYTGYAWSSINTATKPFMTITYTSGATPPVASFTLNRNPARIPNSITATDTSTNTPTSWEWSWGDGTANSTTQNPTHTYTTRGRFNIILTATNAGGSGVNSANYVRVIGYENYY